MFTKITPETRLYLYGIVSAAVPLLISLGVVSTGIAQQIILIVAALLGLASPRMSAANVSVTQPAATTEQSAEQSAEQSVKLFTESSKDA